MLISLTTDLRLREAAFKISLEPSFAAMAGNAGAGRPVVTANTGSAPAHRRSWGHLKSLCCQVPDMIVHPAAVVADRAVVAAMSAVLAGGLADVFPG